MYSHSSTNPTSLARIGQENVEIIDLTESLKIIKFVLFSIRCDVPKLSQSVRPPNSITNSQFVYSVIHNT